MIIKSGLSTPADMKRTGNIFLRPIKDLAKFVPVINFFERKLFNGRSRNYKTVEFLILYLIIKGIKLIKGYEFS